MANILTTQQRAIAEQYLAECADLQRKLWENANNLEKITGCAVNTLADLEYESIDSILEHNEPI